MLPILRFALIRFEQADGKFQLRITVVANILFCLANQNIGRNTIPFDVIPVVI